MSRSERTTFLLAGVPVSGQNRRDCLARCLEGESPSRCSQRQNTLQDGDAMSEMHPVQDTFSRDGMALPCSCPAIRCDISAPAPCNASSTAVGRKGSRTAATCGPAPTLIQASASGTEVCACVCVYMCACVCVCARARAWLCV